MRGQSYDMTAAMSSDNRGLQGMFRKDVPNAANTPCDSHKLDLVIASASKLPQIRSVYPKKIRPISSSMLPTRNKNSKNV